ncbi:MAG: Peptidase family [Candidatus Hydrogenedentota bacterium]|jgi:hypothetical protein
MAADPGRAVRAIVILGAIAFAFLWLSSFGLKRSMKPDETERVTKSRAASDFNGARAFQRVSKWTDLGPRPFGSPAQQSAVEDLVKALRAEGLSVTQSAPGDYPPLVTARCQGSLPGEIVLACAFDTSSQSPGALSSASGAALLVELASLTGGQRRGHTLVFVFLLDSSPVGSGEKDASRAWQTLLEPLNPKLLVFLEGVGDCYLQLGRDPEAPIWLRSLVEDTAERYGYSRHFTGDGPPLRAMSGISDSGIPTLRLVDPIYGGSIARHATLKGKPEDNIEAVCPDSLQAVGDVLYHALMASDSILSRQS